MHEQPATYAAAGVDIAAGDEAVRRIASVVASTARAGVLGGIGGFGGLFELDLSAVPRPVLVASTDGVGTKLAVAKAMGQLSTVGIDLVAMCVDDLVCCGAEPLFLLDYVAVAQLEPAQLAELVTGVAEGCRQARVALLGGETAEHADTMAAGDFDLAGFAVGVVDADRRLRPELVQPGDLLLGLASPGLRSNGYTLARHVLLERAQLDLGGPAWPGAATSLGEELLRPSVIYAPAIVDLLAALPGAVHGVAHITGGGLAGNLERILPSTVDAEVRRASWPVPQLFTEIARLGPVDEAEMERVFNLGIGMVVAVDPAHADAAAAALQASGQEVVGIGSCRAGTGKVVLHG